MQKIHNEIKELLIENEFLSQRLQFMQMYYFLFLQKSKR